MVRQCFRIFKGRIPEREFLPLKFYRSIRKYFIIDFGFRKVCNACSLFLTD
ncbi:Uncharacterized protein dnm_089660 [Desulfonema magnum]|uniref:Uncharacterized protein n=1 Tax=Desulfonema magnum TaxID=45655 RepID=A0A975BWD0_9BACT|nr:Uncharacterized protein dnm_089660 [Desulfonema magnum]